MRLVAVAFVCVAALSATGASVSRAADAGVLLNGVFDTGCRYSHSLRDDPLLHPTSHGLSHLHDFFGNRTTDAHSTGEALLESGRKNPANSTCQDKRDSSAYWAPALFQDGRRIAPEKVHVYYRHHANVQAAPFPVGFGMVTHRHFWWCGPGTAKYRDGTVPACPRGRLFVILAFPACWDGVHLFSKNGTHVSQGGSACDAAHPVRLPRLTMFLSYRVDGKPHAYQLSSGAPSSAHADFLNAWEPDRLAHLVSTCLNQARVMDCKKSVA